MFQRLTTAIALLVLGWTGAEAQDAALYDPAPPPNSSFVRIIDARGEGNLQATIGNVSVTVPETGVSPYVVVPAGEQDVTLSSDAGKVTVDAGKYYTIAFFVGGSPAPALLEDEVLDNPAKSGVYLYNFSDEPSVKLFAPQPNVAVVDDIKPGASAFRAVNAVTVDLAVMAGDQTVASFDKLALKRRSAMSFVVFGAGEAPATAVAVVNETSR
jgi:alginate O-acetyltransferase complex protein AlgF